MDRKINQQGAIRVLPILIVVAAVGVISFLLISATLPFKNLFDVLFPKPFSHAATNQIYWGAWVKNDNNLYGVNPKTGTDYTQLPWDSDLWDLYETHTVKKLSIVHWGHPFPVPSTPQNLASNFDFVAARIVRSRGAIPYLDWGTAGWRDVDIASGVMDQYIKNWAVSMKTNYSFPIFIRLDGEMNGSWEPWGPGNSFNNTSQDYIAMWKHIHDVVEIQAGVTNITWVWCPNIETQAVINNQADVKNIANWYPSGKDAKGDDYVDWTCFDGYNFSVINGSSWQTWDQVAMPTYNHILSITSTKPMMVGETGSSERGVPIGTSKADWLTDLLTNLPIKYPQIKAFVYFNLNATEGGTLHDWAIETSTSAQNAFAQGIASSYYATNTFASPPLDSNGKILPPSSLVTPTPLPTPQPTPTKTPSPSPLAGKVGDLDNDGDVDIFDYATLVGNFGRTGTNLVGDLDRDGDIDIFDYSTLVGNFGH